MSKILAIFGATGQQGSSVLNHVLNDPELSQQFKIRAITRDASSEKAQQLKEKGDVEVVDGDVTDSASLAKALTGVHTVFAMTTPDISADAFNVEVGHAKRIADVALEQGVDYFIWSTLPSIRGLSNGKYSSVVPFDAKAAAEDYIRTLPIKSAFVSLGSFMENFQSQTFLAPTQAPDGTYVLARHTSPKAQFPLIDAVGDTGKFVGAILAEPEKFQGKRLHCATKLYTVEEIAALLSKSSGKTIVFEHITTEEFKARLPFFQDVFAEGFSFMDDYGYFGPGSEELVAEAAAAARGKLSTFEEFLERHPFQLA
ncbi:uncharacterized protein N7479_008902 [Penicillium vulpinum]|uniref:NmrA-like domain-containing protein n=1 Tax=Penicillium vulpinum TaxID=29845 RepID=A0A1V6RFR6_9EURO|nr:uncharacterized protein N7479_008902 [Penicillium vulpinum]KAJ5950489.1 hypothetical protein N7479_008902 [Penicillium vulpinum]OQE00348.1 hypothetical protein PENVUL_c053G01630 [Penicillium vulpinum]